VLGIRKNPTIYSPVPPPPRSRRRPPRSPWIRNSPSESAAPRRHTADLITEHPIPSIRLMGTRIDCVTEAEVVARILSDVRQRRGGWVITPNVDQLRILDERPELRAVLEDATLSIADGQPLIWASRLQREPLPERIAGSSLILSLSAAAARSGASIFFLGGSPGTAEAAIAVIQRDNPALKVAGVMCPPMGFDRSPEAMATVRNALQTANPDIVYACLGSPKQECVIHDLKPFLPSAWFLGLGGSFTIISGKTVRAPRWMQRVGLEWFWRLTKEPRRLFVRYIVHDLPFAFRLLSHALHNRKPRRSEVPVIRTAA
jgi:N-acetylglucosaminyldiphosphoundecaprenol N-acetyl-beta-D-mannosaminyltransferase